MLKQSILSVALLALMLACGYGPSPAAAAKSPASLVAAAPAGYVAIADAELAELEAAALPESELAEASGELGAAVPGDDFNWEYILIFAVIAAAMVVTISID
ncbi:MAG: hypothetical protein H6807_00955 [Planctomycetes bacterium]|nr:hypothetical protein [Planctomycetota bacterium]